MNNQALFTDIKKKLRILVLLNVVEHSIDYMYFPYKEKLLFLELFRTSATFNGLVPSYKGDFFWLYWAKGKFLQLGADLFWANGDFFEIDGDFSTLF